MPKSDACAHVPNERKRQAFSCLRYNWFQTVRRDTLFRTASRRQFLVLSIIFRKVKFNRPHGVRDVTVLISLSQWTQYWTVINSFQIPESLISVTIVRLARDSRTSPSRPLRARTRRYWTFFLLHLSELAPAPSVLASGHFEMWGTRERDRER